MIASGRLNRLVTIERDISSARDDHGAPAPDWRVHLADIWAAVEPLRGREYFAAQQFASEVTHKVSIRWRSGITPKAMRVKLGTRVLRIDAVIDPKEAHEELELLCVETQQ